MVLDLTNLDTWPEFEDIQVMIREPRVRDANSVQTAQEAKLEDDLEHANLADDKESHSTESMIQSLLLAHILHGEENRGETRTSSKISSKATTLVLSCSFMV